jgi:hypothetical protein
LVEALGECFAYLGSRQIEKDSAGGNDADASLEEMADEDLSGITQPIDNENDDSQPPTPHAPAKATDAGRYHDNCEYQKPGTEPRAEGHEQRAPCRIELPNDLKLGPGHPESHPDAQNAGGDGEKIAIRSTPKDLLVSTASRHQNPVMLPLYIDPRFGTWPPDRSDLSARKFFTKALKTHHPRWPTKLNLYGNAASHRALWVLRQQNPDWQSVEIRSRRYLNNIVEQDHRAIKRRCAPMLAMKSFRTAATTLAGVELAHRIRKSQFTFGARGEHGHHS